MVKNDFSDGGCYLRKVCEYFSAVFWVLRHYQTFLFIEHIPFEKDFLCNKILADIMHVSAKLDLIKRRFMLDLCAAGSKAPPYARCRMTMLKNVGIPFGLQSLSKRSES